MSSLWQTIIASVVAILAAFAARIMFVGPERAKYRAEASTTSVQGQVLTLAEARQWLGDARAAAAVAETRADQAELRADAAEASAAECVARMRAMERHLFTLEQLLRDAKLDPPPFVWPRD
jgi:hypothetical protein